MKLILIPILVLVCGGMSRAQTNDVSTNSPAENGTSAQSEPEDEPTATDDTSTNAPAIIETHIYSDTWEFGIDSRSAIYRGNVRLVDPRIELTCEQLTAILPEKGTRLEQVIAETNVVITVLDEKGFTNRAFADKAIYNYKATESTTNEMVELTGDSEPHIERPDGDLYGNPIVWDKTRNVVQAKNQHVVYRGDAAAMSNEPEVTETNTVREQMKTQALQATTNAVPAEWNGSEASNE